MLENLMYNCTCSIKTKQAVEEKPKKKIECQIGTNKKKKKENNSQGFYEFLRGLK